MGRGGVDCLTDNMLFEERRKGAWASTYGWERVECKRTTGMIPRSCARGGGGDVGITSCSDAYQL